MSLYRVEAPTERAVSLAEAKDHLRESADDFNADILMCIDAAISYVDGDDGWLRRALMSQTWDLKLSDWCDPIELPLPPLIEVESIQYYDDADVLRTLATTVYQVAGAGNRGAVHLKSGQSWPTIYDRAEPISIRFRAGYVDTESSPTGELPARIKKAILLYVGTLYAHRETIVIGQTPMLLPWAAEQLLDRYRIYGR